MHATALREPAAGAPPAVLPAAGDQGRGRDTLLAAAVGLLLVAAPVGSLWLERPPAPFADSALATEFSAARAARHLERIAAEPHPVASAGHDRVRDYLVERLAGMGLDTRVERSVALRPSRRPPFTLASVENVVGTVPGAAGRKTVLVTAHYDSVAVGPGAGDNGAGVAVVLEAVRALRAGGPLKNGLTVLFTDAEESGLLGARAAVEDAEWARQVGVVINWDARGSEGPVLMFETSERNAQLIAELSRSGARPVTSSAMGRVYRMLAFGTDFTVFRRAGAPGLNFAFIDGAEVYHSRLDSPDRVNQATLQDAGGILSALLRHFGDLDLERASSEDATYFSLWGRGLVRYGSLVARAVAAAVMILALGVTLASFRRVEGRLGSWIAGAAGSLFAAAVTYVTAGALLWLATGNRRAGFLMTAYHRSEYNAAFVLIALAVSGGLYAVLRSRFDAVPLATGAWAPWLLLLLVAAVFAPETSYIFAWPLLASVGALALLARARGRAPSLPEGLGIGLLTAAAVSLVASLARLTLSAVGVGRARYVLIFVTLFMGLLLPAFELIRRRWPAVLPLYAGGVAAALLVAAAVRSGRSAERPQPNSLFYALNGSAEKAVWASFDDEPDEFTRPFLSADPADDNLAGFVPPAPMRYRVRSAPVLGVPLPDARVEDGPPLADRRTRRIHIRSMRGARVLSVSVNTLTGISAADVNGRTLPGAEKPGEWGFTYLNVPPEGIRLAVTTESDAPLTLTVYDQTQGLPSLPEFPDPVRPADYLPANLPYSDALVTSRVFSF